MTSEPADAPRRVTAIVLNYDGRELLDVVMPTVMAQVWEGPLRVIVVDNGSRDGSAAHVRERWPSAEVLELPDNIGVAAALNRGLALADTEYVALLNNDLELELRLARAARGRARPPPRRGIRDGQDAQLPSPGRLRRGR